MLKITGDGYLARLLLFFVEQSRFVYKYLVFLMSKIEDIVNLIDAGIKAETLRQKAIANNIANLETPGYRRVDVKFEELLAKCLRSSEDFDLGEIEALIYRPKQTPVKSNGNDVNLETEIGQMIKNTFRHKAYVRLLSKKYKQIDMAMDIK